MKKVLFVLLFSWMGLAVSAQTAGYRYHVRYVTDHLLFQQGDAMNVVDYDLEWPEYLNGEVPRVLQQRLEQELFLQVDSTWKQAKGRFEAQWGNKVVKQLAFIPDDNKFCYISCQLREVGLWKERFATFEVNVSFKPQVNSPHKEYQHQSLVVYDMINHEILNTSQIVRMNRVTNADDQGQFSVQLLANVEEPLQRIPSSISLGKEMGIGNQHLIVPYVAFGDNMNDYVLETAYVPFTKLDGYLTKDFLKRLQQSPVLPSSASPELDGEEVTSTPDVMPSLPLAGVTYQAYLAQHVKIPSSAKLEKASSRVIASFVVRKDGSVEDVSILLPCSPSVDREVAKAIKLMPRWKPGKMSGKTANVRIVVPLVFKM